MSIYEYEICSSTIPSEHSLEHSLNFFINTKLYGVGSRVYLHEFQSNKRRLLSKRNASLSEPLHP